VSIFTYDVGYQEERNRLTVAFRIILAIPHLIIAGVWRYLVEILAIVQWFIVLFTGKRNQGIWNLQFSWLNYYSRVIGYVDLLFDEYPPFATADGPAAVRSAMSFEESANRLTCALRIIWAIPAVIVGVVVGIGGFVVLLISWFAIVITGSQSRSMWDFVLKVARYTMQLESYIWLMTDVYPKFGEGAMATASYAPSAPTSSVPPPPPPPPPPM
jgi:Domain of unknown function (DUF4389)